jgi:hypothetical protein
MTHTSPDRVVNFRSSKGIDVWSEIRSLLKPAPAAVLGGSSVESLAKLLSFVNWDTGRSCSPYQLEYAISMPTLPFHRLSIPPPTTFAPLMLDI